MTKLNNLSGMRFGRVVIISRCVNHTRDHHARWKYRCDCGNEGESNSNSLVQGYTTACQDCGRKKHGHAQRVSRTPTYLSWAGMMERCYNPNRNGWKNYGGRGINVCPEWRYSFENFLLDMGERPKGLILERINNDYNYTPMNCKWATRKEQANNRRNPIRKPYQST